MEKYPAWPTPPHFTLAPGEASGAPEACAVFLNDGEKMVGNLIRFSAEAGSLELQPHQSGTPLTLGLNSVKYLRLLRPIRLTRHDELLKAQGAEVIPGSEKQKCLIEFKDNDKLSGDTTGFIIEKSGLYLFLCNNADKVIRYFISKHAIKDYQIGAPLGRMLVQEGVATKKAVDIGLKKQQLLRTQRIGHYLAAEQLVTPEQLDIALKRQKSKPALKLGEALIQENLITQAQLDEALAKQQQDRRVALGKILVDMGAVDKDVIKRTLAKKLGIPVVNLRKFNVDPNVIRLVPDDIARKHEVMPLYRTENALVVAVENPMHWEPLDALRFYTKLTIEPVMAVREDILFALDRFYGHSGNTSKIAELSSQLAAEEETQAAPDDAVIESDNTLVRLVNKMILDAYQQGASDIHIESYPGKQSTHIRFRKDGLLSSYFDLPANFRDALVSRIKVMGQLDISERRKPQDGKINFRQFGPAEIELRVVTMPTANGLEDVVMRILAVAKPIPMDQLGLAADILERLKKIASKSYGLFLICGPTGSGKTTSLHSVLSYINTPQRKIWTAEDPIEITQQGLRQVQVNPKIGLTFDAALRSLLRADPDIIMVGEMRDIATAKTGIEASLTGHLVFSTLHTNSAPESVVRLLDLGMDPFNFSDALLGVLGQRLARRLCADCKHAYTAGTEEIQELLREYCLDMPLDADQVLKQWQDRYAPAGTFTLYKAGSACETCENSGYTGRMGLHELLIASAPIKKLIQARASAFDIRNAAFAEGMRTLKQDGIEKILQGHTDIQQIRAVCN